MIKVRNLTKNYGNHLAVKGISFDIEAGKIYGLLGPNGAGKSTTMNILTGCLAATSGEVKVDGHDIFEDPIEAKKHIGYLPEQPPVYGEMTPREYLSFVAEAQGVPFDPNVHNAVMREDADGVEPDTVTQVFQKGYKLGDRVLRPAMVKVAN